MEFSRVGKERIQKNFLFGGVGFTKFENGVKPFADKAHIKALPQQVVEEFLFVFAGFGNALQADAFLDRFLKQLVLGHFLKSGVDRGGKRFGRELLAGKIEFELSLALRLLPQFGEGEVRGKLLIVNVLVFPQFFDHCIDDLFVSPTLFKQPRSQFADGPRLCCEQFDGTVHRAFT